jgi:hypothetical protein
MQVLAYEASSGFLKTYRLRQQSCEMGEGEVGRVGAGSRKGSSGGSPSGHEEDLLDPKTAIRYAEKAKALLTTAAEEHSES